MTELFKTCELNHELITTNQDITVYFDKETKDILFLKTQDNLQAILSHSKDSTYLLKIYKNDELKCSHYLTFSFFCKQNFFEYENFKDFEPIKRSIVYESIDIILNHPYFNLPVYEADKFYHQLNIGYSISKIEINRKNNKFDGAIESIKISATYHNHTLKNTVIHYKYFNGVLFKSILNLEDRNFQERIKKLFICNEILLYKNLNSNEYIVEITGIDYNIIVNYNPIKYLMTTYMVQDIFDKKTLEVSRLCTSYSFYDFSNWSSMYDNIYDYISKKILYKKPNDYTIDILKKYDLYDNPENLNPNYLDLIDIITY